MAEESLTPPAQKEHEAPEFQSIEVDPEGDFYLLLSDRELRVSSKVLAWASSVFKAQFGPHFAEGRLLSDTNPERIPFLEDDPEAMTVLCNVIHHRPAYPPAGQEVEFLEKLSVACDYYDCFTALSPWASVQLGALIGSGNTSHDARIFLLTYLFDDYHGFMHVTKRMVYIPYRAGGTATTHFISPTPYGLSEEAQGRLPPNLIRTLLTKELQLKIRLLKGLEDIFEPFFRRRPEELWDRPGPAPQELPMHSNQFASVCNNKRVANICKDLAEHRLFPITHFLNEDDLGWLLYKVKRLHGNFRRLLGGGITFADWEGYIHCWECDANPMYSVHHLRVEIKGAFSGLCLDCVKKGEDGASRDTNGCRIPHGKFLGIELHPVPTVPPVEW
ncbi:hypothetical protein MMC30_001933 [Trapelia coarctata]|nr:hypothetical protein [Trapelia coarctata]